jgi:hypothetical protein
MRSASPIFRAERLTVEVTHFGTVRSRILDAQVMGIGQMWPLLLGLMGSRVGRNAGGSCLLCTERDSARSIS